MTVREAQTAFLKHMGSYAQKLYNSSTVYSVPGDVEGFFRWLFTESRVEVEGIYVDRLELAADGFGFYLSSRLVKQHRPLEDFFNNIRRQKDTHFYQTTLAATCEAIIQLAAQRKQSDPKNYGLACLYDKAITSALKNDKPAGPTLEDLLKELDDKEVKEAKEATDKHKRRTLADAILSRAKADRLAGGKARGLLSSGLRKGKKKTRD